MMFANETEHSERRPSHRYLMQDRGFNFDKSAISVTGFLKDLRISSQVYLFLSKQFQPGVCVLETQIQVLRAICLRHRCQPAN